MMGEFENGEIRDQSQYSIVDMRELRLQTNEEMMMQRFTNEENYVQSPGRDN